MKSCPFCAAEIQEAAVHCPYCKMDVTAPLETGSVGRPSFQPAGTSWSNEAIIIAKMVGVALLGLLVAGVLLVLFLPVQETGPRPRHPCRTNLKQIGLALHNYHETYGSFPPAYVADKTGKPMHSWRVLLLPLLGEQALYNAYDFSQPWDSPANQYVLDHMPDVFRCPSDADSASSTTTNYTAVFGPKCVFEGSKPTTFADITDGTSNTLMVGEVSSGKIPWTKPEDIDITVHPTLGDAAGFSSKHTGGLYFSFVDGSVRFIRQTTSGKTLQALFTRNGGEPTPETEDWSW